MVRERVGVNAMQLILFQEEGTTDAIFTVCSKGTSLEQQKHVYFEFIDSE